MTFELLVASPPRTLADHIARGVLAFVSIEKEGAEITYFIRLDWLFLPFSAGACLVIGMILEFYRLRHPPVIISGDTGYGDAYLLLYERRPRR